uniref:Oxidative stress-responsive serine-rich protein 1 n=1 Tax=Glossina brevipalpis TaxID=37001 RepID=A0A1A9W5C7_9MUSC
MVPTVMAAEEELPKELDKLQITSGLPQFKLSKDLPIAMNPFSDSEFEVTPTGSDIVESSVLRYSLLNGCRGCRLRRCSESVLDELKATKGMQVSKKSVTTTTSGAGYRRSILREPVLKALHFYSQGRVRRRFLSSGNPPIVSMDHQNSHADGSFKCGISDFGELITECRNISKDVDRSSNQKPADHRISKNFTTIQASVKTNNLSRIRPPIRIYTRSRLARPKHVCYQNWSTTSSLKEHLQNCTNLLLPKSTASDPEISTSPRYGNSCSQQAGNSATTICDDITINELASYFDTFVHIPKKMSPMAEMMYT